MSDLRENDKPFYGIFGKTKRYFTSENLVILVLSAIIFIVALYSITRIGSWIHGYIGAFDSPSFDYIWTNPSEVSKTWHFEVYSDASYYYTEYLDAFIDWWNPYGRYEGALDYYLYGPMFIYGLYFTYLLLNLSYPTAPREYLISSSVKWTAINFEGLSAVMVYLIIINLSSLKETKVKKHLLGVVGAFSCVFMPMNLLYVDSYYLNIPQMTFFTLLTIFFFLKKKYRLSAYSLSIAWLTKQIPLFILIPLFFYIWKTYDIRKAFKEFLKPFLVSFLIFSIPWIFLTPHLYIGRIFAAGRPLPDLDNSFTGIQHGVTFANTLLHLGAEGLAKFYFWINFPMIPFLIFYGFGLFVGHFNAKEIGKNDSVFVYYITWIFMIIHTFISRGIFKYYDAFLNPFLVLTSVILANNLITKFRNYMQNRRKKNQEGEIISSRIGLQKIIWPFLNILLILSLITGIYAINWSTMITIRHLHPAFLLGLLVLISPLIPWSFYKAVFQKKSYKNLKEDFKEFFRYIKTSILRFYQRTKKLFKKQELHFEGKNE